MNILKIRTMISNNSQSFLLLIIAVGYLIDRVACRHTNDNRNQILDGESANGPSIKIDPILRKALLKALEKLEKEDSLSTNQSPSSFRAADEIPETVTVATSVADNLPKPTGSVSDETKAEDVQFFTAPLVAAFTVQQDYSGIPKAVIPIFKQQPEKTKNETFSPSSSSRPQPQHPIDSRNLEIELKRLQDEHRKTRQELQETKEIIDRQRLFLEPHLERTVITSVQRLPTELVLNFNPDHEFQAFANSNRVQRQEFGVGNFFTNSQQPHHRYHHHHYNPHQNQFLNTNSLDQQPLEPILHDPQQYVNQRLKRLLYFSGFENAHEDLNIVSKVLSLNHYRPDLQPFVN